MSSFYEQIVAESQQNQEKIEYNEQFYLQKLKEELLAPVGEFYKVHILESVMRNKFGDMSDIVPVYDISSHIPTGVYVSKEFPSKLCFEILQSHPDFQGFTYEAYYGGMGQSINHLPAVAIDWRDEPGENVSNLYREVYNTCMRKQEMYQRNRDEADRLFVEKYQNRLLTFIKDLITKAVRYGERTINFNLSYKPHSEIFDDFPKKIVNGWNYPCAGKAVKMIITPFFAPLGPLEGFKLDVIYGTDITITW